MKGRRLPLCFCIALLAAALAGAGNIDYISSRSIDFLRNMARNGATDGADLVSYNPAGLVYLDRGFHLSAGSQTLFKDYTVTGTLPGDTTETDFNSTEPTPFLPSLYAVYRSCDWALYGAFTVPAGGGRLVYEDGLPALALAETALQQAIYGSPYIFAHMSDGYIDGSSMYLAGTAGGSYMLSEVFSVGLAGRYISARRTYDAEGDFVIIDGATGMPVDTTHHELDATKTGSGFGGIISVNARLSDNVNAAIRYETATTMEMETEADRNDWSALTAAPFNSFADGFEQRRDLPAVLAGGMTYRANDRLSLGLSGNYYFVEQADQGEEDAYDDDYGNGYEIATGMDYRLTPEILGGVSYLYSDLGGGPDTFNDFEYSLNAHFLTTGIKYAATETMDLNLSTGYLFCDDGVVDAGTFEGSSYSKSVLYLGIGFDARF
jgi:long-chain fatty acid transport protein